MPKLSDVQAGRIGEYLLSVYAMLTTDGVLVPFSVVADDDHRDLVVAAKGKSAFAEKEDAFSPYRAQTRDIGPRLLEIINALPPATRPLPGARLLIRRR